MVMWLTTLATRTIWAMDTPCIDPVVGFESLDISGEPIGVEAPNLHAHDPRLGLLGDDEVLLVSCISTSTPRSDKLLSRRIKGAFSQWPPVLGAPIEHHEEGSSRLRSTLTTWSDGTFAIKAGEEWVFASADEPGARFTFRGHAVAEDDVGGGVYTISPDGEQGRVLYRSSRSPDAQVVDWGVVPLTHGVVGRAGEAGPVLALVAPSQERGRIPILAGRDRKLVQTAQIPTTKYVSAFALPRSGGGMRLLLAGIGIAEVHEIDERGALVGEPWVAYTTAPSDGPVAFCAWRDGFALASDRFRSGHGVLVSDGVRSTFSRGTIKGGRIAVNQNASLVASPDGRVLLFAYEDDFQVKLARFVCEPGDKDAAYVPPRAVLPPRPDYIPGPFGTKEDVLLRLRQRRILDAFAHAGGSDHALHVVDGADGASGRYSAWDGSGAHMHVWWNETGLVALGFAHVGRRSEARLPLEQRDPMKVLPGVPDSLAPLARCAASFNERLATEGMWITAGDRPAHGESETDVLNQLRDLDDEPHWIHADAELAALASRVAQAGRYTITSEDEAKIFAWRARKGVALSVENVTWAVEELEALGVEWPGAVERARVHAAEEQQVLDARLPAIDRALLAAAHAGDLEAVKAALAAGADIGCKSPEGESPSGSAFSLALFGGHQALAEHLLDAGAPAGNPALLENAAVRGQLGVCERLIARGATLGDEHRSILSVMTHVRLDDEGHLPLQLGQILRLFVDHGAPEPDSFSYSRLVALATESGAADLIPRFWPEIPERLPEIPPALDRTRATDVAALVATAAHAAPDDWSAARRALDEAWRISRHPRVADAAERLARMMVGEENPRNRQKRDEQAELDALDARLSVPPDPQTSRQALEEMARPSTRRTRHQTARCEDTVAALLVSARDVRAIPALEQAVNANRDHKYPLRASLKVALDVLRATAPLELDDASGAHLAAIEATIAARP